MKRNIFNDLIKVLILIALTSCSNDESKIVKYTNFKKNIELKGAHVGPKDSLFESRQMILLDSLLLINDNKTEKVFHLLSVKDFNLRKSFGVRGRGPHEYLFPELSKRLYKNNIVITNSLITSIYNIERFINDPFIEPIRKIGYPPELTIPYNIFYVNDSTILGSTTSGQFRAFNFDPLKNQINHTVDDISFEQRKNKDKLHIGQIFYSINDYNYSKGKFISALRFFKQIDVYNNDLTLQLSIQPEVKVEPVFSDNQNSYLVDNTVFHYIDIYTTRNYIFALYCGKDLKNAEPNIGNEIHVFSWEGKALYKLNLDIGLSNIVITNDENTLIGFRWYDSQPLIVYNLSDIF